MPPAFYILAGALVTVSACWAAGRLLLAGVRLRLARLEHDLVAFFAGAACLHLAAFTLAALGLARKGVFVAATLLLVGVALRARGSASPLAPLPRAWKWLFWAAYLPFAVLYLVHAMAPEFSPDGSGYHLGLVARYHREHGLAYVPTNLYAQLSQGLEMLFLWAFPLGRHSAAALVHCAFLLALPLVALCHGRRFGYPAAGAAAGLFFFLSPVVGRDGTSAYNDVAVAGVLFTLFHLLEVWRVERRLALAAPIGLLAGYAYAMKYTAFLALPFALVYLALGLRRERKALARTLGLTVGCALLMILPWVGKNWLLVGNPFSPFCNRLFPNPVVHVSFEQEYLRDMRNFGGLKTGWAIPAEAAVNGEALGGLAGPLFLLFPLTVTALRFAPARRALAAAVLFALPFAANTGTRFLIPALPFLSLALAQTFRNTRLALPGLVLFHALVSIPGVVGLYSGPAAWRLSGFPWRQATRVESEEKFLAARLPGYLMARQLELLVPPGKDVLVFTPIPDAYTSRTIRVVFQAASNQILGDTLLMPLIAERQPRLAAEFRLPPAPVAALRLVQTARAQPDLWSVTEFRVLRGGQQLGGQRWRKRAWPNPWDVDLAFDLSPVTRWRSWQTLEPGMFLEADFGGAIEIDAVRLEMSPDQYQARMRLEGRDPQGRWRVLSEAPQELPQPPPDGLRRAATSALKARGIDYIVLQDSDFAGEDFIRKRAEWGVAELKEVAGFRLYKIE